MTSFCDAFGDHHEQDDDHWLSINLSYLVILNNYNMINSQIIELGNFIKDCLWCHIPNTNIKIVYLPKNTHWFESNQQIHEIELNQYIIDKIELWLNIKK